MAVAAVAAGACPCTVAAQVIRGTVVDRGSAPVPGVVVLLVDPANNVTARDLTNESGEFRVAAPGPGGYRIRTLRIGFRQTLSDVFQLQSGQEITQQINVAGVAFSLDTVRVVGRNQCRVHSDSAAATFAMWEQARTALTAAAVTARSRAITSTIVSYERLMDPDRRRVREQSVAVQGGMSSRAWRARAADSLRRFGYVSTAPDGWLTYYAPDLEILLSDQFLEDHCFKVATTRDPAVIGIAFEPTRDRRELSEIQGTLWFDRKSDELRSLEFGYTNLSHREAENAAGGDITFARLPNGSWVITRWSIRMPVLSVRNSGPSGIPGQAATTTASVTAMRVAGGELALVTRGSDTLWSHAPLMVAGTVVDSLSGRPIPGARVAIGGARSSVTTDARGRFEITSALPGEYVVETRTASLDSVTAVHSSRLTIADAPVSLTLRVPSASEMVPRMCGAALPPDHGVVTGTVSVKGDTLPPRNMHMVIEWQDVTTHSGGAIIERTARHAQARTDARGTFRLCGVRVNTAAGVRPVIAGDSAAATPVRIPAGVRFARVDVVVDSLRSPR